MIFITTNPPWLMVGRHMRLNRPLSALSRWVAEKRLDYLMVVELSQRAVQHWVIVETLLVERDVLHPLHERND
jgi:hypothetical protein